MQYRKKKFTMRSIWRLRYRFYAVLIMVVLLPILYSANADTPAEADALDYSVVEENFLASRIVRKQIEKPEEQEVAQIVYRDGRKVYLDKTGQEITDELKKAGYDAGFISSQAFVDLNLPLPSKPTNVEVPIEEAPPRPKTLDELITRPVNPQRVNFLRYPKYNINAPIIYSSLEDLFNTNPDGSLNFASPRDTSDINSPVQQKLRDGVLHMAFTPQCGEIGNCYVVGHSSNYSFVKSAYNSIFKPLERKSQVGEEFIIFDRFGRELKFKVFEAKEISENDTAEAYKSYPDKRVATLQTSILEFVPGKGYLPTKRWLTRGELQL